MLERLMTDERRRVVAALTSLLGLMILLWFTRGPGFDWPNVARFAISMILVPLAYFAVYGMLYVAVRGNRMSERAFRGTCGVLFVGGALCLAASTLFAVRQIATHRLMPPPNLLAFGVALGAMKAWRLRATTERSSAS